MTTKPPLSPSSMPDEPGIFVLVMDIRRPHNKVTYPALSCRKDVTRLPKRMPAQMRRHIEARKAGRPTGHRDLTFTPTSLEYAKEAFRKIRWASLMIERPERYYPKVARCAARLTVDAVNGPEHYVATATTRGRQLIRDVLRQVVAGTPPRTRMRRDLTEALRLVYERKAEAKSAPLLLRLGRCGLTKSAYFALLRRAEELRKRADLTEDEAEELAFLVT